MIIVIMLVIMIMMMMIIMIWTKREKAMNEKGVNDDALRGW